MEKLQIEKILPLVQRPTRYIDHEWNSYRKEKGRDAVSLCLCFPDIYEVGASNLGLEILYHLVNEKTSAVAERCYSPAEDMEKLLRQEKMPLFSLETKTPLKEFDIVGFSLQYELAATNVLNMLDLAGIPLFSADRTDLFPLILGGGPMTANPEPLADFFDAFVLGDGEEVIIEIIDAVRELKGTVKDRQALLLALAKIPGVYIPSLYRVEYQADGTVKNIEPACAEVPEKIHKRTVKLDDVYFPGKKIVPYLQTVHSRLNIEVARGCAGKCRFCQASKYYWPWRMRPLDNVLALAEKGLSATGYEEIAFSSLSCTDYKEIEKLLAEVNRLYGAKRISISLPSLRCDQFSLKVAKNLGNNKRSSLTFAPEAGTERLRNVIGKNLPEQQIQDTLCLAWQLGWRLIKLYFMVGLPMETDHDIEGINQLVRSVKKRAQGLNFNVTVSPFVPKAQTAFQWVAMASYDLLRSRAQKLGKILPAAVKSHFIEGSMLEGVFARGDRRLSKTIFCAWQKGCKFDQWKEHFKYDRWQEAFRETGVDQAFYLFRERGENEVLPWDHLEFGVTREMLWADYQRSIASAETAATVEAVRTGVSLPAPVVPQNPGTLKTMQRVRLRFARQGMVRFLSHLEQIEVFRRAVRRADIPIAYTAGFSPQPKMSFGPAVSVSHESRSEYVELELFRNIDANEIQAKINGTLPQGYELLSVRKVPVFFPSLDSLLNVATYEIVAHVPEERIQQFLAQKEIIIEKKKENRVERIDARPLIRELKVDPSGLFLQMRFGPKRNVKPERILQALLGISDNEVKLVPITRVALLIEKRDGSLSEP